jgi:hypothetical protein
VGMEIAAFKLGVLVVQGVTVAVSRQTQVGVGLILIRLGRGPEVGVEIGTKVGCENERIIGRVVGVGDGREFKKDTKGYEHWLRGSCPNRRSGWLGCKCICGGKSWGGRGFGN